MEWQSPLDHGKGQSEERRNRKSGGSQTPLKANQGFREQFLLGPLCTILLAQPPAPFTLNQ